MPPKKGSGKRKARPSEVSSVAASPPPKKPRVLGRVRSDSIPHLSLEASAEDSKLEPEQLFGSDSEKTEIEETEEIPPTGPWKADPENFENHVSYGLLYRSAGIGPAFRKPNLPPRQQRWRNNNEEPITDINDAPKGWNADEQDLDRADVDAQIDRCFERIEDNILPAFFEHRLDYYLGLRAARKAILESEPKDLDPDIVHRLHELSAIQNHLQADGDPDDQLPNIRALLTAYRGGDLKLSGGKVSYWSGGVPLNSPTQFSREMHEKMLQEYDTTTSLWVEGILQRGPINLGLVTAYPPHNEAQAVDIEVKLTTQSNPSESESVKALTYKVLHDTGADIMAIPLPQFEEIENLGKKATLYGYSKMHVAGGTTFYAKVVELELTLLIPYKSGKVLCPWLKVPVAVVEEQPGASFPTSMLSGPFSRFSFYTATCPDGLGLLYLS
ncbi:hypothetical protein N7541_000680 [Penicillium brevicompactum]|uniref:Uncharacterized protein n=1 Tax=Penicillium brevicompactum TaxID=5074 RepID=A0A9W9RX85_PENBR|nr:hypothetical protein N7541_000680 [Penicillium brevicompactum]